MIQKKQLFFPTMARFLLKKISANEGNTTYVTGALDGTIVVGEPDIMWQSEVYIADVGQIWTHGALFGGSGSVHDGLSAYELAVLEGFEGTLDEWLASLKGADGRDGSDGQQGPPGADGQQGPPGADGQKGEKGDRGESVIMGFDIDFETGCLMLTESEESDEMDFELDSDGNLNIVLN